MSNKTYKIDPDFQRHDPTPADFFAFYEKPEQEEAARQLIDETFDRWKANGTTQGRLTFTGPEFPDSDPVYPVGIWLEGWIDKRAVQLPFGEGWPTKDSAIWPPLTSVEVPNVQ